MRPPCTHCGQDLPSLLGCMIEDDATGIEGVYIAHQEWHDRSDQVCILRRGVNSDGVPFELHWFPASRMKALT